jgi:hypothetical protein
MDDINYHVSRTPSTRTKPKDGRCLPATTEGLDEVWPSRENNNPYVASKSCAPSRAPSAPQLSAHVSTAIFLRLTRCCTGNQTALENTSSKRGLTSCSCYRNMQSLGKMGEGSWLSYQSSARCVSGPLGQYPGQLPRKIYQQTQQVMCIKCN